ncbi:Crp/Fnr family transcriptional regulator [Flavobacterium johnsoniae]|uniref:Cyclic nucleotide-binding protein n=1 Tax=Flavobacterium johnsoniae (strain ATCC 17061 / DSM 2064 / JCM 8514 / BCRC 14874 / CCUG 350202 / NBRC 14942 / NCIMB 11054 / UW101) TaxID=376686 RepID=A5FD92_FLAJ1|nr:Crp/Fnr family transcriptional regulator [Flavobacterium johnsoniae]ABQ06825.1 cyclic nucleotide-binding protein [Flavobacterium johnsoniae UW101]OXE97310.1 Crp/Fnr family transcriptional regulator [Flavobacterium johnsoniae UW101]WQG81342.1 Crp/Fnr family transcriptional regulator [Flavobacterium johnsoniae UW101]SHL39518.1 cAMP-binding domain of CRP or a regulatory subunit of cAMP-dependent protein kinases [Flavobacterium johnsoniae]
MKDLLPVINYISRFVDLTDDEKNHLASFLKITKVKKRQFIVQPGFVCKYKSYVVKGAFRGYLVDHEGKEHTLSFAIEDWWISDYSSLIYQEPATLFIEALEDSTLIQIAYEDEQKILAQIPKLEKFERIITQRSLAFQQKRLLSNFTKTAEERYEEFMNKYSVIASRVPQYALASYLGFSSEYLSRIRSRKSSKS